MRFGAAFWIQRTTWPALRDACLAAETVGFDSLWLDDHLVSDEGDWTSPKLEGWTSLAALAPITTRADLGLMVAVAYRRRGIGRALLEQAVTWARAAGVHKLELHVFPWNEPAIALYESCGFVREGLRFAHYLRDGSEVDAILMAYLIP